MKTVNKIWTTSLGIVGLIAGVALTAWGFASHFYPIILGSVHVSFSCATKYHEDGAYGAEDYGVEVTRKSPSSESHSGNEADDAQTGCPDFVHRLHAPSPPHAFLYNPRSVIATGNI